MWKHEIIKDFMNMAKGEIHNESVIDSMLNNFHWFYLGEDNLDIVINKSISTTQLVNELKLPFNNICIEFYNLKGKDKLKTTVFCINYDEEIDVVSTCNLNNTMWSIPIYCKLIKKTKEICQINDPKTYNYCVSIIQSVLLFGKLMSCKNIFSEEVLPPEKVNKKRLKKGKLPIYSYHVLNVYLGKRDNKSDGNTQNGIKQRVHFQRGHFKQYTEEKKLFGKHTGLYWWQPHLRGTNKDGFVDKEYNIIPVNY